SIRDLTTAWRMLSRDPTLDPSRARWELHPDTPAPTRGNAFDLLTTTLSGLLQGCAPYMQSPYLFMEDDESYAEEDRKLAASMPSARGILLQRGAPPWLTLDEFCVLELHNHIAGHDVYRRCENENCGRVFVRQHGRSEHGQSRSEGVRYCDARCARA